MNVTHLTNQLSCLKRSPNQEIHADRAGCVPELRSGQGTRRPELSRVDLPPTGLAALAVGAGLGTSYNSNPQDLEHYLMHCGDAVGGIFATEAAVLGRYFFLADRVGRCSANTPLYTVASNGMLLPRPYGNLEALERLEGPGGRILVTDRQIIIVAERMFEQASLFLGPESSAVVSAFLNVTWSRQIRLPTDRPPVLVLSDDGDDSTDTLWSMDWRISHQYGHLIPGP